MFLTSWIFTHHDTRNISSALKSLWFEKYFSSITMHSNGGEVWSGREGFVFWETVSVEKY